MRGLTTGFFVAASLLAQSTWAEWKTTTVDGVTVKSQAQPGSAIRDFSASATLSAPIEAIQSVLLDSESHASFMPYVVESKDLGADESGKARLKYSRLEFPLVRSRDFILRVNVDKLVTADGGDEFANHFGLASATKLLAGSIKSLAHRGSCLRTERALLREEVNCHYLSLKITT